MSSRNNTNVYIKNEQVFTIDDESTLEEDTLEEMDLDEQELEEVLMEGNIITGIFKVYPGAVLPLPDVNTSNVREAPINEQLVPLTGSSTNFRNGKFNPPPIPMTRNRYERSSGTNNVPTTMSINNTRSSPVPRLVIPKSPMPKTINNTNYSAKRGNTLLSPQPPPSLPPSWFKNTDFGKSPKKINAVQNPYHFNAPSPKKVPTLTAQLKAALSVSSAKTTQHSTLPPYTSIVDKFPTSYNIENLNITQIGTIKHAVIYNSHAYWFMGLPGWITKGFNEFEMAVLTNDLLLVLYNGLLNIQSASYIVESIVVQPGQQSNLYVYYGTLQNIAISNTKVEHCIERIMERCLIVNVDRQKLKQVYKHFFNYIGYSFALTNKHKFISTFNQRIIFDKNQRHFVIRLDITSHVNDERDNRITTITVDLTKPNGMTVVLSALVLTIKHLDYQKF